MKGLVGGPLLVGGLGPGPLPPLKSGPDVQKINSLTIYQRFALLKRLELGYGWGEVVRVDLDKIWQSKYDLTEIRLN